MVIDSIDGRITGRGGPIRRARSPAPTGPGGMLHTLPILVPDLAVRFADTVVAKAREDNHPGHHCGTIVFGWLPAGPGGAI